MSQYLIYHNSQCSKSRASLEALESAAVDFTIKNYREEGLTKEELLHLKKLLQKEVIDFTRTKESAFQEKALSENSSEEELIQAIIEEPKLLERPIIVKDNTTAVIGRPVENTLELLEKK